LAATKLTDDLPQRLRIATIDFLKLHCEGAEYEVLFEASADAIRQIQRIAIEFHGTPAARPGAMHSFLWDAGFYGLAVGTAPLPCATASVRA
jgi:hypothetical protein